MKYIAETLGIKITCEPWKANLPYYLSDSYTFQSVKLGDTPCLFVKPKSELPSLNAVKKHFSKIAELAEIADTPLVLEIEMLNARQRKALIAAHIPFVMDGVQLYLPFIGALLQERYPTPKPQGTKLMSISQLILFRYLYQKKREMYANGLADFFGVSAMHITRAVKQLATLGLFTTRKDGVKIVLEGVESGAALFEKSKPYLHSPVRKTIYIEKDILPKNLPISGLLALSEYTMMNPSSVNTYAFTGSMGDLPGARTRTLVDADEQAEVEFWRYSPIILSERDGYADPLSLWVTLSDGDPRIEIAKDELLMEIWR
jgi:DNA-binding MarR family transcriptional regulator